MSLSRYIVLDPTVCHGRRCFRGTRILVWQVLELLADGASPDTILEEVFPDLAPAHIRAALTYAAALAQKEKSSEPRDVGTR